MSCSCKNISYYHVAPTEKRHAILSVGLKASKPKHNAQWSSSSERLEQQPEGVYVWDNILSAQLFALERKTPCDLWSIATEISAANDPLLEAHAFLFTTSISKEQLTLL
jgi:hypothetical protein